MKNIFYKILIVLSILIYVNIILCTNTKKINKFNFPTTLQVKNYSNYKNVDTLVMIVLNKIFKYDTININIYNIKSQINNEFFKISGFIDKSFYIPHTYTIYLDNNLNFSKLKLVISHELIHLKQMETNRLIKTKNSNILIYDGEIIILSETYYLNRQFEKDAFLEESEILKKLNRLYYKLN